MEILLKSFWTSHLQMMNGHPLFSGNIHICIQIWTYLPKCYCNYEGNYIEKSTNYDPKSCDHNDCFEISVDFIVHIQHANVMGSFGFGWWTYAAQRNTLWTKICHVVQKIS